MPKPDTATMSSPSINRVTRNKDQPPPPTPRSQRVFTEGDEIRLLKCLLKMATSGGHLDISESLIKFKNSLRSGFSCNQINDKIRRLRMKYHKQARSKSLIKSPHDRKAFEIARKIWGKKTPQIADCNIELHNPKPERRVGLEEFQLLVAEFSKWLPGNGTWREGMRCMEEKELREMNDRWLLLQMEEAKFVASKARFMQEHIKFILDAGRSSQNP